MGLEEHIKAGAQLTRDTIVNTLPTGSGSINLGPTFSILKVQSDIPCRLRLYDREESRDNATEISRPFGIGSTTDIALIADFSMSSAGTYTIAPPVFGLCSSSQSPETFYRLETTVGQPSQSILRITRFLLEDKLIQPDINTFYSINNRRTLSIDYSGNNIVSNGYVSGTLDSGVSDVPTTYMFVSASLGNIGHKVRLRMYATSSAIYDLTERNRAFITEPSESVALLIDVLINSGSETVFFTPKIFGANLENMGNDLLVTATSNAKISGNNQIYYYLQNLTSTTADPKVDIAVYALED